MLIKNCLNPYEFSFISSEFSSYKDDVCLSDIGLDIINCFLETNDDFLNSVFKFLLCNLNDTDILEIVKLNHLNSSADITCEILFDYCNLSFSDCLEFVDLSIFNSSIEEEECSSIIGSSFDVGYGNYQPLFSDSTFYVIESLDLLLSYKFLSFDIFVKCRIEFDESSYWNSFECLSEAENYIDDFVSDLL